MRKLDTVKKKWHELWIDPCGTKLETWFLIAHDFCDPNCHMQDEHTCIVFSFIVSRRIGLATNGNGSQLSRIGTEKVESVCIR